MIYASDIAEPEGPVRLDDGSWLVVEMARERGWIAQLSADGARKRVIAVTGRPNGLAVDRDGSIWVAESLYPALLRVTLDGQVDTFMTSCGAEGFLFPNDLAFGPDGMLYMTDSGVLLTDLRPRSAERKDGTPPRYHGRLYGIDTHRHTIRKLDEGFQFTNGIAWGPDSSLYVNETLTGAVYRYAWDGAAHFGPRELFGNVKDPDKPSAAGGPDGMKLSADGLLCCTVYGQGDVTVLGRDGRVVRRILTDGSRPTNCAFGGAGEGALYVTEVEHGVLERHHVGVDGLPLYR